MAIHWWLVCLVLSYNGLQAGTALLPPRAGFLYGLLAGMGWAMLCMHDGSKRFEFVRNNNTQESILLSQF